MAKTIDFKAMKLSLASPEQIHNWSHGEVLKPETINYRTQKPEKDGLFCEKIFGPTKDWECYCGKYKRIRYKGVVCDKCGVEVTRSIVRRERLGHIDLAVPVCHIWFLRGVPSKIGLVLDKSSQELEKVIYFASYIITKVDESAREEAIKQVKAEYKTKKKEIETKYLTQAEAIKSRTAKQLAQIKGGVGKKEIEEKTDSELVVNNESKINDLDKLSDAFDLAKKELRELKTKRIISELEYRDLSMKYGHVFEAGIGAEAIRKLLSEANLQKLYSELEALLHKEKVTNRKRVMKRLKYIKGMQLANISPEWMVLTVLPVIPPDLRPMVQLDGGRYAASDLNDLYRRVINRNNRLKRLKELGAPEVIQRNEKRMLQEAVDALIDNNARRGKAVQSSTGQRRTLKSLADMLRGKQGRFRQNLLGKRVDYSGRSVIVVGPKLKLHECGIPKIMALELFKPFVIGELIKNEFAHNVRSAGKLIEQGRPEVWDALEKVIAGHHVLLNRAPTLHRLGIQAFQPVLIEGKAIQIHPMVCAPYNADFDGDQMAVHVPLTKGARQEAAELMLSTKNLLRPSTGDPVTAPSQDMVLGIYYMTKPEKGKKGEGRMFADRHEAILAFDMGKLHIKALIKVRLQPGKIIETTVGRILFNNILPKELRFINETFDKKSLAKLVAKALYKFGRETAVELVDNIKNTGFNYLTFSGITLASSDLEAPTEKAELIKKAAKEVDEVKSQYKAGLLTDDERYQKVIEIWSKVRDDVSQAVEKNIDKNGAVFAMIDSGARGSWAQTSQLMGMRGLMANPAGRTIELPVTGSFKEGLSVLQYFISTHGARKGLSDTALRTANAGYLTRRLVDVSQDVIIEEDDCGDDEGIDISKKDSEDMGETVVGRIWGRTVLQNIVNPKTKKVIVKKGEVVKEEHMPELNKLDLEEIKIRSVMTCQSRRGVCAKCYGLDLGRNVTVKPGLAVGIIAAQSIGEPGTQLTMRTFHTGGVAGLGDITQGLPRVEELFEARPIKKSAVVAEISGKIKLEDTDQEKIIYVLGDNVQKDKYELEPGQEPAIKDDTEVKKGDILAKGSKKDVIKSKYNGLAKIKGRVIEVLREGSSEKEYRVPLKTPLWVRTGDLVTRGDQLTEGPIDLRTLYKLSGGRAVQKYILKEVQHIYSSQGQKVNDKHVEIIIRQMLSRVRIKDAGDTEFIPGDIVEKAHVKSTNMKTEKAKKRPATYENLLLGITKASLSTDSFLSAASFQETARVLIDAAILGRVDNLYGLKENVIVGKLLPAGTGFVKNRFADDLEE
jgi:DNA-directed RNA polymerase subunit beta'